MVTEAVRSQAVVRLYRYKIRNVLRSQSMDGFKRQFPPMASQNHCSVQFVNVWMSLFPANSEKKLQKIYEKQRIIFKVTKQM